MLALPVLSVAHMRRIEPFFPTSRELHRVDDRRVISGIIYVIRHDLQWKDAPRGKGPHKTLYNRFVRWSRLGVFARIFASLVSQAGVPERLMIDSTHLKEHLVAASLTQKGALPLHQTNQRRAELQAARRLRRTRAPSPAAHRSRDQRPSWGRRSAA